MQKTKVKVEDRAALVEKAVTPLTQLLQYDFDRVNDLQSKVGALSREVNRLSTLLAQEHAELVAIQGVAEKLGMVAKEALQKRNEMANMLRAAKIDGV